MSTRNDEAHPSYFRTPAELQAWFARNHTLAREFWVGYCKRGSGQPSVTWPESVDEALCVGWIDGVRKSIDGDRYKIRFTPRRAGSIWSNVNIRRVQALVREGRMTPAGLNAFASRRESKSGVYSFEQQNVSLSGLYLAALRKNKKAFAQFEAQPPSYRKKAAWWIMSAKKEETRRARLEKLIAECLKSAAPKSANSAARSQGRT